MRCLTVFLLVSLLTVVEVATAVEVVVPNALTDIEGNSNNDFPFNPDRWGVTDLRYQQVFAGSEFPSGLRPLEITGLAFRPDNGSGGPFSATITDIQINLSTTSVAPGGMSWTFSQNVGADDTVVFDGALALSSSFSGPPGGPKDFDIAIDLQTPFSYDPTAGNLLLDVRNYSGGVTETLDADSPSIGLISRVYTFDSGVASPNADVMSDLGLVTQFAYIPEPSTLILLLMGTVGLLFFAPRRHRG